MESVKEFLLPKSFNPFSFFLVVGSPVTGIILLGVVADIETNEQRYSFSCRIEGEDKEFFQRTCFADYQAKTTRGFPLYGFVLLYFLCVTLVSILYSLSVKGRIEEIESQDQQAIPANQSCRLYRSYCIQLVIRLTIGIVFLIIQWGVLYPLHFPSMHACDLTHIHQATPQVNATSGPANTTRYWYDCYNPQAGTKTFWTILVFTIIALLTFLILLELIYVVIKAKVNGNFKKDFEFFQVHLLNKSRVLNRNQAEEMPMINNRSNVENYEEEASMMDNVDNYAEEMPDNGNTVEDSAEGIVEESSIFKSYVAEVKKNIKEKTKSYEALLPDIPGEERQSRELDTIYTNLIMYPGRAEYHFSGKRHEIVEGYLKSQEQHRSIDTFEEIFAHKPGHPQERPLSIMIIGRPGIGKSLLCQKILHDWACGKIFNEETETGKRFEFVCLFKFRHFRSDEEMNLQGLLGRGQFLIGFPQEAYDWILSHPEQVLLIFDGLDEFGGKDKIVEEEPRFANNHSEIMSFSAMYAKLTLGNLLTGAAVVTTSRPTALSCLSFQPPQKFDRSLEILGFSYEEIKTFVTRFCQDLSDEYGKQIWNHISSNGNLLSLCYIPVTCHILCFTFKERINVSMNLPTTLTKIYEDALIVIVCKHNPDYRCNVMEQDKLLSSFDFAPKVEKSLIRLGEVAYAGIKDDRLIFESSEVEGHEESGLLHRLPNVKVGAIQRKEQYCFLHLTLQEFLAAKYIVAQIKKGNSEFESWISDHVRLAGKWEVVMQFVAGLLPDEDNSKVTIFIDSLPHPTIGRAGWPSGKEELVLRLFKYIFEISRNSNSGWEQVIRDKLSGVANVDLSRASLTDADFTSIAFVLQEAKNIASLNVSANHITSIGCLEISHKLLKMLGSSDQHYSSECKLTTLDISNNKIGADGVKHLSDALVTDDCKLTTLYISNNKIGADGVKHLSDALVTDDCKLTTLDISNNKIGDDGVKHLSDALSKEECKLTTLDISNNKIGDDGVKHLSDALSKEECKLTTLNVSWNKIGADGLQYLTRVLIRNECKLTALNIHGNHLGDDGLTLLSDALSTNECKLTKLDIGCSDDELSHLHDVLFKKECKLTTLGIHGNQIPANLLQYFSDTLSSNECKLTTLNIRGTTVPANLLKHLPVTLSTLNIKATSIENDGLKPLCDALSSNECKLTTLKIHANTIQDNVLKPLYDALSSNECKLTTLKISVNHMKDDVLKPLCDALSSDNCNLTTLKISTTHIQGDGLKPLCDALSSDKCKLTTLNIYFPGIDEHKLKQLSDALGGKECKITIIEDTEEKKRGANDAGQLSSNEHKWTTLNVHATTLGHH